MATPKMEENNTFGRQLSAANEEAWLSLGRIAEMMGDDENTMLAYEKVLSHNRLNATALFAIGCCYEKVEDYTKAADCFRGLVSLNEQNSDAWGHLGYCCLMMNDLTSAHTAYQYAMYNNPMSQKDPNMWYGIGQLYERLGSLEHAQESFEAVLRFEPNFNLTSEEARRMRVVCCSISWSFGSAVTAALPSFPSSRFPPLLPLPLSLPSSNFPPTLRRRSTPSGRRVTRMALKDAQDQQDPRLERISSAIRVIPDFPKPGILFQDITTLLLDPKAFKDTIDLFVERYRDQNINVVAGVEARGFIFGPPIALAIGAKFVPMRKPNKLPGEVISEEYSLEYGTDKIEMHVGAVQPGERALVIDDLIATGGTLDAAIKLLERVGVDVVECACLIELPELKLKFFQQRGHSSLFWIFPIFICMYHDVSITLVHQRALGQVILLCTQGSEQLHSSVYDVVN